MKLLMSLLHPYGGFVVVVVFVHVTLNQGSLGSAIHQQQSEKARSNREGRWHPVTQEGMRI